MLYELVYESLGRRDLSIGDLESLLKRARVKNERLGITGMLVYHNREFIQLLEGERETVLELFDTIAADDRHSLARVLWEGEIEERGFSKWTMGFLDTRQNARLFDEGYTNFLQDGILTGSDRSPTVAKRLFRHLRQAILRTPIQN